MEKKKSHPPPHTTQNKQKAWKKTPHTHKKEKQIKLSTLEKACAKFTATKKATELTETNQAELQRAGDN